MQDPKLQNQRQCRPELRRGDFLWKFTMSMIANEVGEPRTSRRR